MEDAGFIMLVGLTGSGKSTFISRLTGQHPQETGVGHNLTSSTIDIANYTAQYDQTRIIRLIDTPGFDDTTRSNADILHSIASCLSTLARAHQRLLGIICLHRITDVRLSGSAIRNFTLLKKLCGPQNYHRILLATTMWSQTAPRPRSPHSREEQTEQVETEEQATSTAADHLLRREELLVEYWHTMFDGRSRVVRHVDGETEEEAARRTIGILLDEGNQTHNSVTTIPGDYYYQPLQIQREMVEQGLPLEDTEAGRYIRGEILSANIARLDREIARRQELMDRARRGEDGALERRGSTRTIYGVSTGTSSTSGQLVANRLPQQQEEQEGGLMKAYRATASYLGGITWTRSTKDFFGSVFSSKIGDGRRRSGVDASATQDSGLASDSDSSSTLGY